MGKSLVNCTSQDGGSYVTDSSQTTYTQEPLVQRATKCLDGSKEVPAQMQAIQVYPSHRDSTVICTSQGGGMCLHTYKTQKSILILHILLFILN